MRYTSPLKKGAFVDGLVGRFVEFCKMYSPFFDVFSNNVSPQARCYLSGLLMKAPRKNMERMEEYVEECDYEKVQQFLTDSPWDDKALQAQISKDVSKEIGSKEGVLVIDESGFTKKGKKTAGVARQWNGRLGKTDNCQVGVFAALVKGRYGSLIDKRLYLPKHWVDDTKRCKDAGIPDEYCVFKTKPQLGIEMIDSAIENKVEFGYVTGDGFYGNTPEFLRELDNRKLTFVLDVHRDQMVYMDNPKPYLPRRKKLIGPKYKNLQSRVPAITVTSIIDSIQRDEYSKINIRESTKGTIELFAWRKKVYLWDGKEKNANEWWLVITKGL